MLSTEYFIDSIWTPHFLSGVRVTIFRNVNGSWNAYAVWTTSWLHENRTTNSKATTSLLSLILLYRTVNRIFGERTRSDIKNVDLLKIGQELTSPQLYPVLSLSPRCSSVLYSDSAGLAPIPETSTSWNSDNKRRPSNIPLFLDDTIITSA